MKRDLFKIYSYTLFTIAFCLACSDAPIAASPTGVIDAKIGAGLHQSATVLNALKFYEPMPDLFPTRVEVGQRAIGYDLSERINLPHGIAADANHVFVTEPL